jgi:hypothetical protein
MKPDHEILVSTVLIVLAIAMMIILMARWGARPLILTLP